MARRYEELRRLTNGHTRGITAIAFSAEGNFIATAGLDGKVCVWQFDDGNLLYSFSGQTSILSLTWIPQREDALICGSQDGNVTVLTITAVSDGLTYGEASQLTSVTQHAIIANGFWAHKYPVECLAIMDDLLASGAHRELTMWKWNDRCK